MDLQCQKCKLTLGEMEKGKIRNGAVLLCSNCWDKAKLALEIADMASQQTHDLFGGEKNPMEEDPAVQDFMSMLGMKGKKR